MGKKAIIIGAGPAGLTAAYELIERSKIQPLIFEATDDIGGISKTVNYKGNRIDIGGHRFFSKSDTVMNWWRNLMPIQGASKQEASEVEITYHNKSTTISVSPEGPDPQKEDRVMLLRNRLSRIFFLGQFFDYPISLNLNTLKNLGFIRIVKIGWTYFWSRLFPIKEVETLEDFFINRFGKELYNTFFKDYTEKVWGVSCKEISAEWGAQRIKKLSISKALWHALKQRLKKEEGIDQKKTETSLIEQFMYPKFGPGQIWELVAEIVIEKGAQLTRNAKVIEIHTNATQQVTSVTYLDILTNTKHIVEGDYVFSTMPVKNLISAMGQVVPPQILRLSQGLQYRDFITVGLLLNKLKVKITPKLKP